MMRFFDFIFLMRPTLWVPVWTFFLLGLHRSGGTASFLHFARAFMLYTILMSGVYVLNQIIDIESDRVNKKLFLLADGHIKIAHAWIEFAILFVLAWILAIPYSFQFKLILFFSMILGILYSAPPFKFKCRPIFDLFSNAIGYGVLAFSLGWVRGAPFSRSMLIYSLPYFFAVGAVFINTTIPDIKGDKQANEITTGLFLGEKRAYWLSTVFIIISFGLSVWLGDRICRIASVWSMPLFLWAAIRQNLKTCLISIRVGAPMLTILVGLIFWWFIPLLILVFIAQRIYYKRRFNIIYPKIV
ncbi:MAG: UbiA family prenyltransferase [Candidatus Stahlbacteria bacterium]|nr:UbiA family prenyltransferase [Candidatus Stahlbacteria bacterium]